MSEHSYHPAMPSSQAASDKKGYWEGDPAENDADGGHFRKWLFNEAVLGDDYGGSQRAAMIDRAIDSTPFTAQDLCVKEGEGNLPAFYLTNG